MAAAAGLAATLAFARSADEAGAGQPIRVRYTPQDRVTGRYQYVPFEVPAGATRLTVSYAYDRAGGANVVDLGLYEPGPIEPLGTPALRGWSGGERQTVTIEAEKATPGYWPGEIPAGRWHAGLGLYKVAPEGVEVTVTVGVQFSLPAPSPRPLPPRAREPLRREARWYAGALHTHTVHSDGTLTVTEMSRMAKDAGLDFIAITDHNNTVHQTEAVPADGVLRIVGEEVTTPGGHASVWGLGGARDYVDFRVSPGDPRIGDLVRATLAKGALFSINHPSSTCVGCGWEHAVPEGVTGIEVSNGRHQEQEAALAFWDRLLREGRRLTAVGSSDWHRGPAPIDRASVRVWAPELSTKAILDGIRQGRVVVMADGRMPPPEMVVRAARQRARTGDTLRVRARTPLHVEVTIPRGLPAARVDLVGDGRVVESKTVVTRGGASGDARVTFTTPAAGRTVRVHAFAADGSPLAVVNPVYLDLTAR